MKTIKYLSILLTSGLLFFSCSDDDNGGNPAPVNEEEVITTLNITLTPSGGGTAVTFSYQDLDADGPNPPVVSAPDLAGNTTYNATIEVLNETESPAEDITAEVQAEDDEHQFIFEIGGSVASATATDTDGDGNPVGLSFDLVTNTAGAGTLTVTLRHEPTKPNDGTLTGAGGETDIAAPFTFTIN
ncbi:type 1 periplasmic binding fold superfamily protein [uncultured Croceitalea sp.]|uniref:type 1 periplasmic binding fold superfamily protein n=1 Tax=uncultured Croceitalea sp. TaxID=1798908 RepID=UPI003305CCCE